jgi:hypothetical protein
MKAHTRFFQLNLNPKGQAHIVSEESKWGYRFRPSPRACATDTNLSSHSAASQGANHTVNLQMNQCVTRDLKRFVASKPWELAAASGRRVNWRSIVQR